MEFLSFRKARKKAQKFCADNGITSQNEWESLSLKDLPEGVPPDPHLHYSSFTSWNDWLGLSSKRGRPSSVLPYEEAKSIARDLCRTLGIRNSRDWQRYVKDNDPPEGVPKSPYQVYRSQWEGWEEWTSFSKEEAKKNKKVYSGENAGKGNGQEDKELERYLEQKIFNMKDELNCLQRILNKVRNG